MKMRLMKCGDEGCQLEDPHHSQLGSEQDNIAFMAGGGAEDGLTPLAGSYLIPLRSSALHSSKKRRPRRSTQVGGSRKRVTRKKIRKRPALKRIKQVGGGRKKRKKGKRRCVKAGRK